VRRACCHGLPCFYGRIKFTADGDGDPLLLGPLVAQVQGGQLKVVHLWPPPRVACLSGAGVAGTH
jgi:hypothetical protein